MPRELKIILFALCATMFSTVFLVGWLTSGSIWTGLLNVGMVILIIVGLIVAFIVFVFIFMLLFKE